MLENNEGFGWIADTSGLTAANVALHQIMMIGKGIGNGNRKKKRNSKRKKGNTFPALKWRVNCFEVMEGGMYLDYGEDCVKAEFDKLWMYLLELIKQKVMGLCRNLLGVGVIWFENFS